MSKRNKPQIGDYIEHHCAVNGKFQGMIVEILAMQFVYETSTGITRFCLFSENWNYKQKERD